MILPYVATEKLYVSSVGTPCFSSPDAPTFSNVSDALNRMQVALDFVPGFDPLWDNMNRFRADVSARYVARIKGLSPETVDRWHGAFRAVPGNVDDLPENMTLLLIVRQERLFDGNALKAEESEKLLARLKSIPGDALKTKLSKSFSVFRVHLGRGHYKPCPLNPAPSRRPFTAHRLLTIRPHRGTMTRIVDEAK